MAEGFWDKTKRLFRSAVDGAAKALPMSLLYSAVAFGASAAMKSVVGVDPLHVTTETMGDLVTRVAGAAAIGMTFSGGMNMFSEYMKPTPNATPATSPAHGHSKETKAPAMGLALSGVKPPPTPTNHAPQRSRETGVYHG